MSRDQPAGNNTQSDDCPICKRAFLQGSNPQFFHPRKIRFAPFAGLIDLGEENLLTGSIQRLPVFDPSLKSAKLAILIFTGIFTLQGLKKRLCFKAAVVFEEVFNLGPVLGKCIRVGGPVMDGLALTRQRAGFKILAGGFSTHTSLVCELIEVFDFVFHSEQSPCLFVGNHLKSPDLRKFR